RERMARHPGVETALEVLHTMDIGIGGIADAVLAQTAELADREAVRARPARRDGACCHGGHVHRSVHDATPAGSAASVPMAACRTPARNASACRSGKKWPAFETITLRASGASAWMPRRESWKREFSP